MSMMVAGSHIHVEEESVIKLMSLNPQFFENCMGLKLATGYSLALRIQYVTLGYQKVIFL